MDSNRVTSSAYLAAIARRILWRAWWFPAIALAVIATGLMVDIRMAIIGLMLLLIIYPMVMSFVIIRYAALPQLALRTLANVYSLKGKSLTLFQVTTDDETGQTTSQELGTFEVSGMEQSGTRIIFKTGPTVSDIVIVPADAIDPQALSALETAFESAIN